jgi:serine/threonine protein kinase
MEAQVKEWVKELNGSIVRFENLKRFKVIKQLGTGGQANVYLVSKSNSAGDTKSFAMKVIKRETLVQKSAYE